MQSPTKERESLQRKKTQELLEAQQRRHRLARKIDLHSRLLLPLAFGLFCLIFFSAIIAHGEGPPDAIKPETGEDRLRVQRRPPQE